LNSISLSFFKLLSEGTDVFCCCQDTGTCEIEDNNTEKYRKVPVDKKNTEKYRKKKNTESTGR
jgi:hypothetical protein